MWWLLPIDDDLRLSRIALYFSAVVEWFVTNGTAWVALDAEQVVGVAMWRVPAMIPITTLPTPPAIISIVMDESRREEITASLAQARHGAATTPGAYLSTLAVVAEHRGRGIGATLMDAGHDVFGSPTWLETTNPRNQTLYRRMGYRTVHQGGFGGGTMTRMVREVE